MRVQKKIVRVILALIPVMGVLFMFATSYNAKTETYPYYSRITFHDEATPYLRYGNSDAINAKIVSAMYSNVYNTSADSGYEIGYAVEGVCAVLARFADRLRIVTGIPLTYLLICFWYAFYLFVVELSFMVMDIVTFVPRKCGEFFGG